MVRADLHVHTTNSDGSMALGEVPRAAKRAGVSAVAVTDHDRLHPDLAPGSELREGVRLIHGIELRVEAGDQRLDLLGYGAQPTVPLERETERIQADRIERGRAIIENVEDRLGVDLDLEPRAGLGRPHIARATAAVSDRSYEQVFDELIGDGGPCFVPRDVPTFETGRELLGDACALVGLAHPFRYPDPGAALARCADLDAVERYYPYDRDVDPGPIDRAIERYEIVPTGGSDAHDDVLGRAGLDADDYERFLGAAGLPLP